MTVKTRIGNQRLLAWLLAVCMLTGMLPAAPISAARASGGGEDKTISYDFMEFNDGKSEISSFTSFDIFTEEVNSAPWKYHSNDVGGLFKYLTTGYGIFISGGKGTRRLMLQVPRSGYFQAEARIAYWMDGTTNTASVKMRLVPCSEEGTATGDAIDLGCADSVYPDGSLYDQSALLKACYLDAGNYILEMEVDEYKFIINSFNLIQRELVIRSEAPAPVAVGETLHMPLSVSLPEDLETPVDMDAIQVSAEDVSVAQASVADDGQSLHIQGKAPGSTTLTVTVEKGGASEQITWPVTVYAPGESSQNTWEYNWNKVAKYSFLNTVDSFDKTSQGASGELVQTRESAPWRYEGAADSAIFQLNEPTGYCTLLGKTSGYSMRIRVPESGRYTAATRNWFWANGKNLSIYLRRADGKGPLAEDTLLGSVNTYDSASNKDYARETELTTLNLAAGDYILTYVTDGANTAIHSFALKGQPVSSQSLTPSAEGIVVSRDAQDSLTLTAARSDSAPADYQTMEARFTYSDPEIAEAVAAPGADGIQIQVTGKAVGTTEITVALSAEDGALGSYVIPVTVEDAPASVTLSVTAQPSAVVKAEESVRIPLTITKSDGSAVDFQGAVISASWDPEGIAEAAAVKSAEGVEIEVTGQSGGSAKLTVSVDCGGTSASCDILVTVARANAPLVYDFVKPKPSDAAFGSNGLLGLSAIPELADFSASISAGSAPWRYLSGDVGAASFCYIKGAAYGIYLQSTSTSMAARQIVIRVPEKGTYRAEFEGMVWNLGAYTTVSLIPCDASGTANGDAIPLGVADTYDVSSSGLNKSIALKDVALEAGDYILNMAATRIDGTRRNNIFNSFRLTPLKLLVSVEAPAPVQQGGSIEAPLDIRLPGQDETIVCQSIDVTGLDPEIAEIALSEDGKSLIVKGLQAGNSVAHVTVSAGGVSESVDLPITIYNPYALSESTFTYNFYKMNTNTAFNTVTSFNQTSAGATGELNLARETAPWKFDHSANNATWLMINQHGYGSLLYATTDTAIRIRVPENGRYQVISQNWFWTEGGELSIAIQSADGTGVYASKTEIGSFDTYAATAGDIRQQTPVGTVDLVAGDYIISYSSVKSGSSGSPRAGISALILKGRPGGEGAGCGGRTRRKTCWWARAPSCPVSLAHGGQGLPVDDSLPVHVHH